MKNKTYIQIPKSHIIDELTDERNRNNSDNDFVNEMNRLIQHIDDPSIIRTAFRDGMTRFMLDIKYQEQIDEMLSLKEKFVLEIMDNGIIDYTVSSADVSI